MKSILLSYFRDSGKRIFFLSVNRDPLYFRFVNRARGPPPPPTPGSPSLYDPLLFQAVPVHIIIKFPYIVRPEWLKQRSLSQKNRQVEYSFM